MTLDTVKVSVTRDSARSLLTLPFAVTTVRRDNARPAQKNLSLAETLALVPGLFAANRENPSQDPRISIRGFGSRSAFGVRGIRVLWNGIPLTLADGQTPLDYVDVAAVDRIEIIRGSASALFGNSSGGVIAMSSSDTVPGISLSQLNERGGLRRTSARIAASHRAVSAKFRISRTAGRGFRDFSQTRATRTVASGAARFLGQQWTIHLLAFDMPLAQNPGSLTLAQMRANPRLADPLSIRKGAGKSVDQKQVGVSTSRPYGRANFTAAAFAGLRNLDNPLTFATVRLHRTSGGLSAKAALPFSIGDVATSATLGFDAQTQNDDRHELENCSDFSSPPVSPRCPLAGRATGAVRRNQRELVSSLGTYAKTEFLLGTRTLLSLAGRHDVLRFRVYDRMPVSADQKQSGSRTMGAFSPMVGVVFQFSPETSLYASASTAFETPTATELINKPDGTAGLNPNLYPQISRTFEAGLKGRLRSHISYELAAFLTGVRNELIPFEVSGGAGRRFYRNAGHTSRAGVEASATGVFGPANLTAVYTGSHFRFDQYSAGGVTFAGKRIPGIPDSKFDASFTLKGFRAFFTADLTASSRVFVNDLNASQAPGYSVFGAKTGTVIFLKSLSLRPMMGVTNMLDSRYSASVNINAAGGKYYEPGSERVLYGMIEIGRGF